MHDRHDSVVSCAMNAGEPAKLPATFFRARRLKMLLTVSPPRAAAPIILVVLASLAVGQNGSPTDSGSGRSAADWEPVDREAYERQRREAHARLEASGEDTMHASTPAPPDEFPLHLPAPNRWVVAGGHLSARRWAVNNIDVALAAVGGDETVTMHTVAFFPSAADAVREGFVRIINHAAQAGSVDIHAIDDDARRFRPLSLSIGAKETVHFNSGDLETGNSDKGLSGATGPGVGDWRLELESALDVEVLAYVRTRDGFLTSMHDIVAAGDSGHRVAFFNPGANDEQVSRLRVVNVGDDDAEITVTGVDDRGVGGSGEVGFSVSPGAARTVTARKLEAGDGLDGGLGDGAGKWQLLVRSSGDVRIVNLLDSPTGHITNLSTVPDLRDGEGWTIPLFPEADDASQREGFVRVINRGSEQGEVTVDAFDDTERDYEPVVLTLSAGESAHFNSHDLESGNRDKGLSSGVGAGEGAWRLALRSELDLEVLAYVRTLDGFVTAMHDSVPARGRRHRVPVFNPASNHNQVSRLHVVNPSEEIAAVTVSGIDGEGRSPGTDVRFTVPAGAARSVTAQELETGEDLDGALGDGAGKWQLVVSADRAVVVMSLLESPTGHLTNLSTAGSRREVRTAGEAFEDAISTAVVQAKCVNCHVEGGVSGNTRLVFVTDSTDDHAARNLEVFRDFIATVDGAASLILNKIQGVAHGGGIQVAAGSEEFEDMRTFLDLLAEGDDLSGPELTAGKLFDTVHMESARRTLNRAALIFAGRLPTTAEMAPFPGGTTKQLRDVIRGMMTGPAFHAFMTRGANDRLLTESLRHEDILADGHVGTRANSDDARFLGYEAELERLGGTERPPGGRYSNEYYRYQYAVRYGAMQAPVELIARVVESDLPYTEILTADYIMANGATAKAYSDPVAFDDPDDPFEFRPARFRGYRRYGVTMEDYPHAGILNTTSFLVRYPTTPTNRNRARSRWTYNHFLGFDIQNAAPTVTDADALLDTRNPTMHNPACTVCHIPLDPAAGAFQNYLETGFYRGTTYGRHALPGDYTYPSFGARRHEVGVATQDDPKELVEHAVPFLVGSQLALTQEYDYRSEESVPVVRMGPVTLRDYDTGESYPVDLTRIGAGGFNGTNGGFEVEVDESGETVVRLEGNVGRNIPVDIPADARYDVEVAAWREEPVRTASVQVAAVFYRGGDTWFRDMREPGFEGTVVPDAETGARWLAERMAEDPRFAEGAVKFWWPAVMGDEIALTPSIGDPDFDARLVAATAQAAEVARLAREFRRGFHAGDRPYNLKDLLAAMVLSPWFRAERNLDDAVLRTAALRDVGARRLLTPEELAAKTASVTGYQWGRRIGPITGYTYDPISETSALTREYELLYGGIDSETKLVRSRDLTATMAAVAKVHAIRSSCPIILREFYLLPVERRRLFSGLDVGTAPDTAAGESAIRDKLAELHEKLFGIEVGPDSADVDTAFDLFVDTLERKGAEESGRTAFRDGNRCDTDSDILLLEGVVAPPFLVNEGKYRPEYEQNDPDGLLGQTYEDPDHLARTWVVVLAYLMMDYRYLYL